jgi:hypothetical protein
MSFPSGYTADTLNRLVWDAGVFSYDVGGTRTYLGIRRDATSWDLAEETRVLGPGVANGIRHRIAGGRRVLSYQSTMDVATMELDADIAELLVPGGTAGTAAGITTITPPLAGVAIAVASLIKKPRITVKLSGTGGFFALEFDYGYVASKEFSSEEGSEGQLSFTLESEVDPTREGYTTADPDYRFLFGADALMTATP